MYMLFVLNRTWNFSKYISGQPCIPSNDWRVVNDHGRKFTIMQCLVGIYMGIKLVDCRYQNWTLLFPGQADDRLFSQFSAKVIPETPLSFIQLNFSACLLDRDYASQVSSPVNYISWLISWWSYLFDLNQVLIRQNEPFLS